MRISVHVAVSLILAAMLFPVYGLKSLFILAGGVLIDADHYLYYIIKFKNFSLAKSYRFFSSEADANNHKYIEGIVLVLHTAEFLAAMLVLSFYGEYALMFTVGMVGHYILDAIWFMCVLKRFVLNHSIISWIIKKFKYSVGSK